MEGRDVKQGPGAAAGAVLVVVSTQRLCSSPTKRCTPMMEKMAKMKTHRSMAFISRDADDAREDMRTLNPARW